MAKKVGANVHVIDADGHGGEPQNWQETIAEPHRARLPEYRERLRKHFSNLPGGGLARKGDREEKRRGMYDPAARIEDMDLEGIDVSVLFPGGAGEEWAMLDRDFAIAVARALNNAHHGFCQHDPKRLKTIAKLPFIDPKAAAAELKRCVGELGMIGMVCPQHIRDKNLDHPDFDVVWAEAERLGVCVCVHGGGQALDQVPLGVDRWKTRLEVHAFTHPVGQMTAVMAFTVGGILHRFPKLRVAFMESGCSWLPYWLERLDEHWELMPEQAPNIDRKPSEYFKDGRAYISCEPAEHGTPWVANAIGDDKIVYASDYYHWDCSFPDTVKIILERTDLPERSKAKILGQNAARLYSL
jgi:predicted TIM-barrel fold metal-dependent hydrolase